MLEKDVMLGMISDKRGKGHPRTRWLDTSEYQELNIAGLKEAVRDQKTWRTLSYRVAESRTRLNGFQVQAMWGVNFLFSDCLNCLYALHTSVFARFL